jgi:hypothetical protein
MSDLVALAPGGAWTMDPAGAPTFPDSSGFGASLTVAAGSVVGVAGAGKGGDQATTSALAGSANISAASESSRHRLVEGSPFALAFLSWTYPGAGQHQITTQGSPSSATSKGWMFRIVNSGAFSFLVSNGTTSGTLTFTASDIALRMTVGGWHLITLRYSGGAIAAAASWEIVVDGVSYTPTASTIPSGDYTGSSAFRLSQSIVPSTQPRLQHIAVWSGSGTPSAAQLLALWNLACGTARWTLPVSASSRTLKGFQIPGSLSRSMPSMSDMRHGVRAYYQIGAGARTEFDPGDDLSVTIPAGSACYLDADFMHHDMADLPWVADALGGGPVALWDEADPVLSVSGIASHPASITVTLSQEITGVTAPVNDPAPALQITSATANGSTLTLAHPNLDALYPPDSPRGGGSSPITPPAPPVGSATRSPAPPVGRATRI